MKSNNIGKLIHIKKLCNDQSHLQMLASNQRPTILSLLKKKKKKWRVEKEKVRRVVK